jgi:hypothetical protein
MAQDECKRCHFYVVVVPKQHVLFRFTERNNGEAVARILAGFPRLHLDASAVYHEVFRNDPDVVEVGCWAHGRRKFFEALSTDRDAAMFGIGMIGLLYDAHNAARRADGRVDVDQRRAAARPLLARLFAWARAEYRSRSTGDPMKTAVGYLLRQRRPLRASRALRSWSTTSTGARACGVHQPTSPTGGAAILVIVALKNGAKRSGGDDDGDGGAVAAILRFRALSFRRCPLNRRSRLSQSRWQVPKSLAGSVPRAAATRRRAPSRGV